jgi:hypothetical protein
MAEQITKMYRVTLEHDEGYSFLTFNEYEVIRHTEKTAWIKKLKWGERTKLTRVSIQAGGRQPFAFTTKKDALNAFIHRKKRHLRILRFEFRLVEAALEAAKTKHNDEDD